MAYTRTERDGLTATKEYDLDVGLSLVELTKSLDENLRLKKPSSCFFMWSGRRQNEKMLLDLEQQRLIIQQLNNLSELATTSATTKASLFLIPTTVKAIIANKENEVILARRNFMLEVARIEDGILEINHNSERRTHENNTLAIENLRKQTEIEMLRTQNKETESRINLIQTVLDNIDFKNLDPTLSTYILTTIANPQAKTEYGEMRLNNLLEQHIVEESRNKSLLAEQNAELKKQEVEEKRVAVDDKKLSLNERKKNFG